jgi:E3 ubiquitin-protein ligase HUWE1
MAAFQSHSGLAALVGRLQREVKLCSKYHGDILSTDLPVVANAEGNGEASTSETTNGDAADVAVESSALEIDATTTESSTNTATSSLDETTPSTSAVPGSSDVEMKDSSTTSDQRKPSVPCQYLPQRAALLKSILNFLKKAIPDPAFADNTRSLMDDSLQTSLKLIISNAEYYGALLFLLATDVVTVFIFHEPSLLSSLQDSGLTWVVLKALIVKDVPATRENLASLPNTLSALCLNTRGLNAFVSCKPFERLFRILISPEYLPAMKRRRSSDPQGDTAMHLGSAMD